MSEEAKNLEPVHLGRPAAPLERADWRWVVAAVVVGAVSAFAAALVRLSFIGLEWVFTHFTAAPPIAAAHLPVWRRALTPVAGALLASAVLFVRTWRAGRKGRDPRPYIEYVEAVRHGGGLVPFVPNCWRTVSAAFSVASGAAVGREGSMIQFAAACASVCGRWLGGRLGPRRASPELLGRQSPERKPLDLSLLVALGVAGGVTTAYNAPVASVFFAAEIVLGAVEWRELPFLGLASAAGWAVSGEMLGFKRLYPAHAVVFAEGWRLLLLPVFAAIFGCLGPLYQMLIRSLSVARKLPLALVWSGVVVGLASVVDVRVWGNGDLGLSAALGRAELPGLSIAVPALAMVLLLRLASTTACVGTGTVGGVFTPTLFAGGAAGALLSHAVTGADQTFWCIAGMSCLMAGVTHAPLMAAFMAVELTGCWPMLPWLLAANLISWQIASRFSHRALYAIASPAPAHPSSPYPAVQGTV